MPEVLVTLCNLAEARDSALLRLNLESGAISHVALGANVPIKSCTGLIKDASRIYVLCADAEVKSYLAVLNRADLQPIYFQFLPEIIDPHSMLIHQNRLIIVSTGNDALFGYDLLDGGVANPSLVWNIPDDSGTHHDTHHLNSIAHWNGDIIFSAFGAKKGQTWSSAVDGYLYNVTKAERLPVGIYQPHSLKEWEEKLYYCESARGRVACLDGAFWELGDYTRGLDFVAQDIVAVGSSVARKISKSTGFINNPGDPGKKAGSCEINVLRLSKGPVPERLACIPLADYGSEIYEVLCIDDLSVVMQMQAGAASMSDQGSTHAGNGNDSLQAKLLEQHQLLSELNRAHELKAQELQKMAQLLKQSQEEYAASQSRVAQQAAELELMEQRLKTVEAQLALERAEPKYLNKQNQHVTRADAKQSGAPSAVLQAPQSWLTRIFKKRR